MHKLLITANMSHLSYYHTTCNLGTKSTLPELLKWNEVTFTGAPIVVACNFEAHLLLNGNCSRRAL